MDDSKFIVPAGSVVITPTELYREMQATHVAVSEMRADVRTVVAAVPDHESRLRALERKLWVAAGLATGLGGTLGAALGQILGGA